MTEQLLATEQPLATEQLTIPVFHLSSEASITEESIPDFSVSISLTESVMAELCQVLKPDEVHCVYISDFQFLDVSDKWQSQLDDIALIQLHLQQGPVLAVMVVTDQEEQFVSPWLEFAPEFDLGLDDDVEDDSSD
jgi:hypothetical protein